MAGVLLLIPSILCAVLPMVALLVLVWWLDRYEREPWWLLGLTFLWGGIGGVLFGIVGSLTLMSPLMVFGASSSFSDAAGTVLIAPLAEEPSKALFLLFVLWNRNFDNMTDGFVYGAAAGLGFGMTENFMYFTTVAMSGDPGDPRATAISWAQTVLIRTLYSAIMHASATSIVGASLGYARFRGPVRLFVIGVVGLLTAIGVHMLWNGLITLDLQTGGGGTWQTVNLVIFPFEVLFLFLVFQVCLLDESRTIRRELAEEAHNGVLPKDHPHILASWVRRQQRDWLPPGVDHRRYVSAATSLALRKKQARMIRGRGAEFYRDEVYRLRRAVKLLLERA